MDEEIKKVKDKDKINTIALFHTFLLSNVLNVTNANYQKIKLQKLTKKKGTIKSLKRRQVLNLQVVARLLRRLQKELRK